MDTGSNGEQSTSWGELYNVNLMPSELFLKFRKELDGYRVGFNLELYNAPINDIHAKVVLKPFSPDRKWKFVYEPIHHDVHLLSKTIPLTKFLNLQVGIGHNFQLCVTGWKWKLTSCLGGDGISRIQNETSVGLCPGVDLCFGWRADFVLPKITGALGTDEPLFNMNSGRLQASLDRVEAILTIILHDTCQKSRIPQVGDVSIDVWIPPANGSLKFNVDGSFRGSSVWPV